MKIFFILFLFHIISVFSLKINTDLQAGHKRCFSEVLMENSHVIGEVSITSQKIPNYGFYILNQEEMILLSKRLDPESYQKEYKKSRENLLKTIPNYNETDESHLDDILHKSYKAALNSVKFTFVSKSSGKHQFCIQNNDPMTQSFDFNIAYGVEANDYSNLAKKLNLKPTEENVLKIEDYVNKMKKSQEDIWVKESHKLELSEKFNSSLIWISVIAILVIVSFGTFEYFVMKHYFKQKKLI